jgi:decaprenylphospho-beta-D-erythro-pentofuranosid-2-ulose 2-reductase
VNNALQQSQTIVLLGGTSEIGLAILRQAITPATRRVVLACRDVESGATAAASLRRSDVNVDVVHFDGAATETHSAVLQQLATTQGDLDLVIVAFAQLGDPAETTADTEAAAHLAHINFTGNVSAIVAAASVMRRQGHGQIVVLSSVAGERVRKANPVYGGTKAGLDGFCQGLGDALADDGVQMLVVRPGFVHTKMTQGMQAAPFATTPEKVAEVTVKALRAGRRMAWAPGILRPVFSILRHLPGPVWRRLPLG